MTPSQAAESIGCSPQYVRSLCRRKKLAAKRVKNRHGQLEYEIERAEVERFKKLPIVERGVPRGSHR